MTGRDLIRAAKVRATISQVEKFNTAINTFYGKYSYLPGDIPQQPAAQYGFAPHGVSYGGQGGDGNGYIEGNGISYGTSNDGQCGEPLLAWEDLSSSAGGNLIEGGFNTATSYTGPSFDIVTGANLNLYLPEAKLGGVIIFISMKP